MMNLYGANGLIASEYADVYSAIKTNDIKFITLKGGRYSAKGDTTYTLMLLELAKAECEARVHVPIQRNIKTGVLKQVIKVAKRIGLHVKVNMSDYNITLDNGSKIYFYGLDANKSTTNTDLSKGADSDLDGGIRFCIFDELGALNEFDRVDDLIDTYSRQPNCQFIEISNPPKNKASALNKRYIVQQQDDQVLVKHTTVYDLPKQWLTDTQIQTIKKYKETNRERYEHSILGLATGVDGLAFQITEDIWSEKPMDNIYSKLYIQTDEGTVNATTFSLFGMTPNGQLHYITNYYHSSKEDGVQKASSTYAGIFKNWYQELGVQVESIVTDGVAFATELRKVGFNAKAIGGLKDRVLSYKLLQDLVLSDNFKIINSPENIMLYEQMANAEVEYNSKSQPMISKKHESTTKNEKHTHALDTVLYMCLRLQKQLLRGSNGR